MTKPKIRILICCLIPFLISFNHKNAQNTSTQSDYSGNELSELNDRLSKGWNTWNTRSVLSHVLLPECFAVNLQLVNHNSGDTLKEALIGRSEYGSKEHVIPGPHSYDGSYTELVVEWQDIRVRVQSAAVDEDLYLLIKPIHYTSGDALLLDPQMLWDRKGEISVRDGVIRAITPSKDIELAIIGSQYVTTAGNIRVTLSEPIAISSDSSRSVEEIEQIIKDANRDHSAHQSRYPETPDLYDAMQTVLAWDLIYEPTHDRVIAPVSRTWNVGWEGWILFDWDTYFAAYMFSLDNKEHAYANAIAITKEITEKGFIPNFGSARCTSEDRSQPPVGSFVVKEIYKKYQEKWFLHEVFDELLSWNRWWADNRDVDRYLCWGSDPYEHGQLPAWLERGIGAKKGAKWESGLDNSPMYDDAVFEQPYIV